MLARRACTRGRMNAHMTRRRAKHLSAHTHTHTTCATPCSCSVAIAAVTSWWTSATTSRRASDMFFIRLSGSTSMSRPLSRALRACRKSVVSSGARSHLRTRQRDCHGETPNLGYLVRPFPVQSCVAVFSTVRLGILFAEAQKSHPSSGSAQLVLSRERDALSAVASVKLFFFLNGSWEQDRDRDRDVSGQPSRPSAFTRLGPGPVPTRAAAVAGACSCWRAESPA